MKRSTSMQRLPYRTNTTWLTDADLILLDVLFDGGATFCCLRHESFRRQWNVAYSHNLADTELRRRLEWLCEHCVLQTECHEGREFFHMRETGGELWSQERCPSWDRYCTERYKTTSRGRTLMSVATVSAQIRDDFLRLLFVEYEPTWEWRFIKEVFHRDKLVGPRGFRTFLRSADPKVRQTQDLFLPTLTPPRSEFFANDVIFLGDLPASALSTRFCELLKEFVGKFGGGLVVIAGPRFGPGQLAQTPLADLLPVIVDPEGRPRDEREFRLKITPEGERIDFLGLGESPAESRKAWDAMGKLPW